TRAADATLADAEKSFSAGEGSGELALARGWLALGVTDGRGATQHFTRAGSQTKVSFAQQLVGLGLAWAAMEDQRPAEGANLVRGLALGSGTEPALRYAACLTRARGFAAATDHRRALASLRAARKLTRGTVYADDLELEIALEQIAAGKALGARATL